MLIDIDPRITDPFMEMILSAMGGGSTIPEKLTTGIFKISHFNFEQYLDILKFEQYPKLTNVMGEFFGCFGVCDHYEQILAQCSEIEKSQDRSFVISVTEIKRHEEEPDGGWRWHKWGDYIGIHEPQHEYLYDEKGIDSVFVYHIFEIF